MMNAKCMHFTRKTVTNENEFQFSTQIKPIFKYSQHSYTECINSVLYLPYPQFEYPTNAYSALASFTETGNGCALVPRRQQPGSHLVFGVVEFCQRMDGAKPPPVSGVN